MKEYAWTIDLSDRQLPLPMDLGPRDYGPWGYMYLPLKFHDLVCQSNILFERLHNQLEELPMEAYWNE